MAKFRRNHTKSGNVFTSMFSRVLGLVFIIGLGLFYLYRFFQSEDIQKVMTNLEYNIPDSSGPEDRFFLPKGSSGQIIHHDYYSLSYNEQNEQSDWVAYELTKASIILPNVPREREFRPDYDVNSQSAFHRDYTNSGYTRGHLAPAGDMAFNSEAMKQSFYMSNMSPQIEEFNGGIWRELEENVRDWAYKNEKIYIVTGPALNRGVLQKIGENKVSVPKYFYKVVLDIQSPGLKGIGFIIPNEMSDNPLSEYAVTIDSVESFTGFDFFSDLMAEELEVEIESNINIKDWPFDEQKFKTRNSRYQ